MVRQRNSRKICRALLLCILGTISSLALAQKDYEPWETWSKKDAEKILNDSPWGQTQTETDTSELVFTPTTQTGAGDSLSRRTEGATNQAVSIKFRIRWLSSRPIRQALARRAELESGRMSNQMRFFAQGPSEKRTVIAVAFDANDQRLSGKAMQAFNSANTGVLKNSTYLERKDGRRIFLQEYVSPQQNPLGMALFIFPRYVDEKPLLAIDSGSIRFHSEYENKTALDRSMNPAGQTSNPRQATDGRVAGVSNQPESAFKFKLDMRFKVSEMIYQGNLEY